MDKEKVMALATLARIEMSLEEAENLTHEFESILSYISEIKEAGKDIGKDKHPRKEDYLVKNVMRKDEDAHESGQHTERLLEEAPKREGDYVKVKQILG